ncbi:MAG: class I SAM-dependent methyltransferase [Burkholderiaceae bacterium]
MTDWGAGYVTDVGYLHGYFRELAPPILRFALICAGVRPPRSLSEGGLSYLELGYGQGVSLNIHAAACRGEFWGTDFNPAHAALAQDLSKAGSVGTTALDASFEEFLSRADVPSFDVIAMHGVWSWVSVENRARLVEILRRHLKPGGVTYVSYNSMPGWSGSIGLKELFKVHADLATPRSERSLERMDQALAFARRLMASDARFFLMNPDAAERLKRMGDKNRTYLAHEYLNDEWHPMSVLQVAGELADAKLSLAATVDLLQAFDRLHLSHKGSEMLSELRDPVLREAIRDYLINQVFRRDLYVRGIRKISDPERVEMLGRQRFMLLARASDVPRTVNGTLGEAPLDRALYDPLLEVLSKDAGQPMSLAALEVELKSKGVPHAQLFEAIVTLTAMGYCSPAQDDRAIEAAVPRCKALNRHLCEQACASGDIQFLASPVVGHGVPVGRVEQIFLLSRAQKGRTPDEWAEFCWKILGPQGLRLKHEDRMLESSDENLSAMRDQARRFAEMQLPTLIALKATP